MILQNKIKVLGFVSAHYGLEYEKEALLSILPFVEKVHIAYSKNPSHGFGSNIPNPDKEYQMRKVAKEVLGDKLIWESYEGFHTEADHRNIRYKYSEGYDLILTVDFDEVYNQTDLIEALIQANNRPSRYYGVKGYKHFFKSFDWYFEDDFAPIRIENLKRDNQEQDLNLFIETYHMSLCQNIETIRYKFSVFGHKNEIKPNYLEEKFLAWSPEKINDLTKLHPTLDTIWEKPTQFNKENLPDFLKNKEPFKIISTDMKVLLIPLDYQRHKESPSIFQDLFDGFQEQVGKVMMYNGDKDAAISFMPDVIYFQGSLTPEELKYLKEATRALVTMWTGDARYVPQNSLIVYKDVVDAFLLPFSGQHLKVYETVLGKPCLFIWEPIQNWRFKVPQSLKEGETTFVGNIYDSLPGGEERVDLINYLKGHTINFYGNGSINGPISYEEVPKLYNKSFLVICENNYNDLEDYFTPRNIGAMAAGSCSLHRYFPGIEKYFQNLVHCVYYRNKYELKEWIEFFKNNPEIRNTIASQGYQLATSNFTFKNWVNQYLNIIKTHFIR